MFEQKNKKYPKTVYLYYTYIKVFFQCVWSHNVYFFFRLYHVLIYSYLLLASSITSFISALKSTGLTTVTKSIFLKPRT